MTQEFLITLVKIAVLLGGLMGAAAYFVLLERRVAAWIQDRRGPNRVGIPLTRIRIFGLGQPAADGGKFILKEEFDPAHVDRWLYTLAPIAIFTAAIAVFAAIPVGDIAPTEKPIPLLVAPEISVGVLYVFAVSSIAVYGVLLGGWASNNKYSFLGAMRSSAQLIAYEIPLGLGVLGAVLAAGSLDMRDIMFEQARTGVWFAFSQPLGFAIFAVAAFAEAGRLPFDMAECEQELVGGYHTEYSGMKLMLFLVAEFLHMITASFLIVILFLGGWHFWGLGSGEEIGWLGAFLRLAILLAKVVCVILFFMFVRWSWPRFRFDQLMALAWKVLLPLGLLNFIVVAALDQWRPPSEGTLANWLWVLPAWGVFLAAWIIVSLAQPTVADNRPQREIDRREIDWQI